MLAVDKNHEGARFVKADALETLAEQQVSANARNYYLTSVRLLRR